MMRILCASDLAEKSDAAVERAGMLADELVAEVSLLHVLAPSALSTDIESELDLAAAGIHARTRSPSWGNRPPEVLVRAGRPSRVIVDVAQRRRAGLVVLGAPHSGEVRGAVLGTIAKAVLRAREFPTLIVRQKPLHEYRNVVLALDLTDTSEGVIRGLESMGITGAQRCTVVHAYETPYEEMLRSAAVGVSSVEAYLGSWRREHRAAITEMLMEQSAMPWRYDIVLEEGKASSAILRSMRDTGPDLLVMGARGARRNHRSLLGNTAKEVLRQAHCDVLLMPYEAALTGRIANGRPANDSLKLGSLTVRSREGYRTHTRR